MERTVIGSGILYCHPTDGMKKHLVFAQGAKLLNCGMKKPPF